MVCPKRRAPVACSIVTNSDPAKVVTTNVGGRDTCRHTPGNGSGEGR